MLLSIYVCFSLSVEKKKLVDVLSREQLGCVGHLAGILYFLVFHVHEINLVCLLKESASCLALFCGGFVGCI